MKKIIFIVISILFIIVSNAVLINDEEKSMKKLYSKFFDYELVDNWYNVNLDTKLDIQESEVVYISTSVDLLDNVTDLNENILIVSGTRNGYYYEKSFNAKYFLNSSNQKEYSNVNDYIEDDFIIYCYKTTIRIAFKGPQFENINIKINSKEFRVINNLVYITKLSNPYDIDIYDMCHHTLAVEFENYDVLPPVFEANENVYTEIGSSISITDIVKGIKITDEFCGDLTGKAELISTNYNPNQIGTYYADLSITDDFYNTATFRLNIHVVDFTAPTITGVLEYNVGIKKYITIDEIISNLIIKDNSNVAPELDIEDNYTGNKNRVGSYKVIVNAIDGAYNKSSVTITINVSDDLEPVVVGENVTAYMSENKTIDDFKIFTISDNVSSIENINVSYETNFNPLKKGEYYITCTAIDEMNNVSSYKIVISYFDDIAPEFVTTSKIAKSYLNMEELKKYFNN